MADYQEYRRRILRKRWRRTFAVAGLLVLLILLSAVGLLWKHLHREQSPARRAGPDHLPAGAAEQRVEQPSATRPRGD